MRGGFLNWFLVIQHDLLVDYISLVINGWWKILLLKYQSIFFYLLICHLIA